MNNKNIIRTAFPFIAIFVISIAISSYTYIQNNITGARAEQDTLTVTAVNTRNPLSTTDTWDWNVLTSMNRRPQSPITLTYIVNWCIDTNDSLPCIQGTSGDFFYQITKGSITVQGQESAAKITHQSINCGRIDIEIKNNDVTIARGAQSTKTRCSRDLANNVSSYVSSPSDIISLINALIKAFSFVFGGDKGGGDVPDDNPGGDLPGDQPGEQPGDEPDQPGDEPGDEPDEPGDQPGGEEPPAGDVCSGEGASCNETYREACDDPGDPPNSFKVCYKIDGTCSGKGNGTLCSWVNGRAYCDPCIVNSANDPLPGQNPGQNPPREPQPPAEDPDPEVPDEPQDPVVNPPVQPQPTPIPPPPAEPLPPSDNSEAQLAIKLSEHLINNCIWKKIRGRTNEYNSSCAGGFSGSRNDNQAISEIQYSANNVGETNPDSDDEWINHNHLQCVGFVEGAVAASSGNSYDGPGGHAGRRAGPGGSYNFIQIISGTKTPLPQYERPQPNDLAVWKSYFLYKDNKGNDVYSYGHIAYVTSATSNTFTVVEANLGCPGCVRSRTYVIYQEIIERNLAGYLRKR